MAHNQRVFEEALQKAHDYAWAERWDEAVREYERAVAEFPDHQSTRLNLGMAYLQSGRPTEALAQYQQAAALAPDDPLPLDKIAALQQQAGDLQAAAQTYARLAQLWERAHSAGQALAVWQRVVALTPGDAAAHRSIAENQMRLRRADDAVAEYLLAARLFRNQGSIEEAAQCCDEALALHPYSDAARALRESLSVGRPRDKAGEIIAGEEAEESPLSAAVQLATSRLAARVFEEQAQDSGPRDLAAFTAAERAVAVSADERRKQLGLILGQAIDYQTRGVLDRAIVAYRRALEQGGEDLDIRFNLGILCYKAAVFEEAIQHLQRTADVPEYALATCFALAQCHRAQGQIEDALENYVKLLHLLDRESGKVRADDFLQLYQSLMGSQGKIRDRERAVAFVDAMTHLLTGKDWRQRLDRVREQMGQLATGDVLVSLAEIVEVQGSDKMLEGMQRSRQYLAQNLPLAAIEECYAMLELAPNYLPVHAQLAEVLLNQDKVEQAVAKYEMVASTYQIRGDIAQAIGVYQRILDISPLHMAARAKLISLLTSRGQSDEALAEYVAMAQAYYQLAQPDKMLETYQEALTLAARSPGTRNWPLVILKGMADVYMQRLDWNRAANVYQEIKRLDANDDSAQLTLIDLHYRSGQRQRAEAELDELVDRYRQQERLAEALQALRGLVESYPAEAGVSGRLARLLFESGQKEEAVAELDRLGEQQLEQGRLQDAIVTVRQIIALNPQNLSAYQQLLRQLESPPGSDG